MKLTEVVVQSDRLRQVSITEAHAEDIFTNFTSDVATFMYPQPAPDISAIHAFIKHSIAGMEAGSNLQLVILSQESGEFLGCSGLHDISSGQPELGIWLKRSAHGHAYGLESIGALIAWARENVSYEYIKYPVDVRNIASKRIPEFYGGVAKKRYPVTNMAGRTLDIVEYWIDYHPEP